MSSPQQALEAFVTHNPDLERLEKILSRFNLFEAVGVIRQELRHSDLLATLLDPSRGHNLKAVFLRSLLNAIFPMLEDENAAVLLNFDTLKLNQARVLREWQRIDILVVDDLNRFAVIIENKIDSSEIPGQLERYYADVQSYYPAYEILALYLTPNGDAPSSDRYLPVSYSLVCQSIEKVIAEHRPELAADVAIMLEHYAQMIRRHIVRDSDVAELCRDIYRKHRQAINLIIEHRLPQKDYIKQYVEALLQQHPDIQFNFNSGYVVFSLHEWQNSPRHGGEFGDNVCWILYFGFDKIANGMTLDLKIAPGDTVERERHLQLAQKHNFRGFSSRLRGNYSVIASFPFLTENDYEKPQEEVEAIISEKWNEYLRDELPRIVEAVRQEEWLWTVPQNTP